MDTVKFVPMLVGLLLAVVMVGAVFVPVISSSTTRTVTTEIENEGAGWLALGYNEGTDYSFTVGYETITVEEVETEIFKVGNQTGEYENMICYADPQRTLFVSGDYWYLLTNGENPSVYQFTDNASVTNASGTLTILDGSETVYTGASPTWAYVPDENGVYGFFTEGGLNLEEGKPKVAVGSYAGVFAYNQYVTPYLGVDLGLVMDGDYSTGEVVWRKPIESDSLSSIEPFNPGSITIRPIDFQPIVLDPFDSAVIKSVPTPTYSDGVWGFDIVNGNEAKIVSYSGSGGNIIVPSTLSSGGNTYTVTQFGKGGSQNAVFDNTTLSPNSTIVLPNTLVQINNFAFYNAMNLTGTLTIPDSVTTLKDRSVMQSGFSEVVLSSNITSIGDYTFYGCTNLVKCDIPEGVTSIGDGAFNTTKLQNVVIPEGVTSIKNSSFTSCIYEHLILPKSLVSLNGLTFGSEKIKDFVIQGNPTITGSVFSFAINSSNLVIECLNLSDVELTTTSYGMNISEVREDIPALGYIAPISIHKTEVVPIDSPVAGLMQLLPLIAGIGALFLAVGTMIYTRF